jgi:predicted extracellular nuclease
MTHRFSKRISFIVRLALMIALSASWLSTPARQVLAVSTSLVISQVQTDGDTALDEFVELHNISASAVNLSGYTIIYRSASGTTDLTLATLPAVSLPAGAYYLVAPTDYNGAAVRDLAYAGSASMSKSGGGLALRDSGGTTLDMLGWGTATNAFIEGTKAAAPATSGSLERLNSGCTDTDNNATDFSLLTTASPRNSGTTPNTCGPVGETAPSVSSVSPQNNASGVAISSNLTINFNEPVNVTGTWVSLTCTTSGAHSLFISGGPSTFTANPDADFVANETCTAVINAAAVTDVDSDDPPDAMTANYTWTFSTFVSGACAGSTTAISAVQGSGATSPVNGSTVTVQGQVVADFQSDTQMKGFYIQSTSDDGNPATSDGIFIYDNSHLKDVNLNDVVKVTGKVAEFQNQTQIGTLTDITLCSSGNPAISPVTVNMPETVNGELERYEGMLIHIPQTLYINQNYFLGRYGQVTLSVDSDGDGADFNGLMYWPTNGNFASNSPENNLLRIIILDDASSVQNPNPIPYMDPVLHTNRVGDTLAGVTGVLDQGAINSDTSIIDYRIQPTFAPVITYNASRTAAPQVAPGNLKVATFNVLNYFNGNGAGGGFPTSRGATTLAEFNRQRAKIISALQAINADVVGLMEIENDGTASTSAVQDLVNGLNTAMGAGTYDFVREPAPGSDEIKVAMIYKPAVVTPVGVAQNFQVNAGGYSPLFDRPPLAQTFSLANGEKFSVVVNHFKSRRCTSASGADLDQGNYQGCYSAKRLAQAEEMVNIVNTLKATDPDVLVIGDLNAYGHEDPLLTLWDGDLNSLTGAFVSDAERYTYVFDGWLGELDHGLATTHMLTQTLDTTIWHINSAEPNVIDYNTEFKPQDFYAPDPYRSSDHDPVVMTFDLTPPMAVQVTNQQAESQMDGVLVTWNTTNETDLLGFNLYRSLDGGPLEKLNTSYITGDAGSYDFLDADALAGKTYEYWIEIVTSSGTKKIQPVSVTALFHSMLPIISK